MSLTGKIKTIFLDKEKTTPIFPRTKTSAVTNEDGILLDDLLGSPIFMNDEDIEASVDVRDADTLCGKDISYFAQKSDIKPKAGFIYPLATPNVPDGFLLCDGKAYSRTEYVELFAAIGTYYGEGDGSTTFNVPNLQTRVPVGAGNGYELGSVGGEAEHILTVDEMPSHAHDIRLGETDGYDNSENWALAKTGLSWFATPPVGYTGGDQPHNNMQPYTVINYIISTGKESAVYIRDVINGAQAIPLEVQYGGTGATNADDARKNLGVKDYKRNLLDNSDFINPVNQRGGVTYTGSYGIDRWRTWENEKMTNWNIINGKGVSVEGTMFQYHEASKFDTTKTYTLAACYYGENGAQPVKVLSMPIANYSYDYTVKMGFGIDTASGVVAVGLSDETYVWAALYEGEYTAETLPPYVAKEESTEIAQCQMCWQWHNGAPIYVPAGVNITIYFPTRMRIAPTVILTSGNGVNCTLHHVNHGGFTLSNGNGSMAQIYWEASADL